MSARRRFRMQEKLAEGAGSGLLDIPHLSILKYRPPGDLLQRFRQTWGSAPEGVILPVTAADGLNYEVEGTGLAMSAYAQVDADLPDFSTIIAAFAKRGVAIYLLLDPTLTFCRTDSLHVIDIAGDSSSSLCISNPRSQELLAAILGTGIDEALITTENLDGKLKGVVIDAVNLWPMGATDKRIELTCFCRSCEGYFNAEQDGLVGSFRNFPNPWNLVLKDSGTGIAHVHEIRSKAQPNHIVGLSRQKGFTEVFKDASQRQLLDQARTLLKYMEVRHTLTFESIREILNQALEGIEEKPARILLSEGVDFDWSCGLFLEELDSVDSAVDEVWFDPRTSDLDLRNVRYRSYLWRRSRYYVDAFLHFAGQISDKVARATMGIAKLSDDVAKGMLMQRLSQAVGTGIEDKSVLAALPPLAEDGGGRIGFVGVALDREIGEKLVDGLSIASGLPRKERADKLLEMLQSAMADDS